MIVQFLGRHGEVLKTVTPPPLWDPASMSISIREVLPDDRKEHFPARSSFPEWDPKRKVIDLAEPPPEAR